MTFHHIRHWFWLKLIVSILFDCFTYLIDFIWLFQSFSEKQKTELEEKCYKLREQRFALEAEKSIIEQTLSTLRIEYDQLHK